VPTTAPAAAPLTAGSRQFGMTARSQRRKDPRTWGKGSQLPPPALPTHSKHRAPSRSEQTARPDFGLAETSPRAGRSPGKDRVLSVSSAGTRSGRVDGATGRAPAPPGPSLRSSLRRPGVGQGCGRHAGIPSSSVSSDLPSGSPPSLKPGVHFLWGTELAKQRATFRPGSAGAARRSEHRRKEGSASCRRCGERSEGRTAWPGRKD